jgi:hypothetical protein
MQASEAGKHFLAALHSSATVAVMLLMLTSYMQHTQLSAPLPSSSFGQF